METLERDAQPILDCLEKVLRDPAFTSSQRLADFLRYVVTETLEGRGDRLKGYAIAVSVFRCGPQFNPQTNSVVRVEATRLRKTLATYYEGPGKTDPFEIRINRGAYVPEFIDRSKNASLAPASDYTDDDEPEMATSENAADMAKATGVPPVVQQAPWLSKTAIAGIGVLCGAAIAALSLYMLASPALQEVRQARETSQSAPANPTLWQSPPSISVTRLECQTDPCPGDVIAREIASALGPFESLRVFAGEGQDSAGQQTEYQLSGRISEPLEAAEFAFQLVRTSDQRIIWTKSYKAIPAASRTGAYRSMVENIVTTLSRTSGVILADRYRRMPALTSETFGFECIIHSTRYFSTPALASFTATRDCLERTLRNDSKSSSAHTAMALHTLDGYIKGYTDEKKDQTLTNALSYANIAVELAPSSARAYLALSLARFYDKRYTDAFEAGRRAIALNPNSIEIKGRIGSAYILRGEFQKGMELINEVEALVENRASWLEFYIFLNAYMNGNFDEAERHAQRATTARTPLGLVARAIMSHRSGKHELTKKSLARLSEHFPHFASDIPGALSRLSVVESIQEKLLADLNEARVATSGN